MGTTKYWRLILRYGDLVIGRFKTRTTDLNLLYKEMSEPVVLQALKDNINIKVQIKNYKLFCDNIHKQKFNCYKLRASDLIMYLTCYLCLTKFNVEVQEPFFYKLKKKKKITDPLPT